MMPIIQNGKGAMKFMELLRQKLKEKGTILYGQVLSLMLKDKNIKLTLEEKRIIKNIIAKIDKKHNKEWQLNR